MQFCKVKVGNDWSVTPNTVDINILSAELLLDPMEYLQFIKKVSIDIQMMNRFAMQLQDHLLN